MNRFRLAVVTAALAAPFLSWFARQSPSTGIYGLYDMAGVFSTYSTAC